MSDVGKTQVAQLVQTKILVKISKTDRLLDELKNKFMHIDFEPKFEPKKRKG